MPWPFHRDGLSEARMHVGQWFCFGSTHARWSECVWILTLNILARFSLTVLLMKSGAIWWQGQKINKNRETQMAKLLFFQSKLVFTPREPFAPFWSPRFLKKGDTAAETHTLCTRVHTRTHSNAQSVVIGYTFSLGWQECYFWEWACIWCCFIIIDCNNKICGRTDYLHPWAVIVIGGRGWCDYDGHIHTAWSKTLSDCLHVYVCACLCAREIGRLIDTDTECASVCALPTP